MKIVMNHNSNVTTDNISNDNKRSSKGLRHSLFVISFLALAVILFLSEQEQLAVVLIAGIALYVACILILLAQFVWLLTYLIVLLLVIFCTAITGDLPQLMLQADDLKSPFVISNLSEQDVLVKKASTAFLQLAVSLVGGIAFGLGFAGRAGSFGALPWLLCSLVPIIILAIITLVLMYNDLIFLKNRVWATLANIEVSLKKRSTLIPQLETIAKAYFEHEKEFQQHLASLRSLATQSGWSNADGNRYLASEAAVSSRMLALVESYPNLKGNEAIEKLMTALRTIENELGFRAEYNLQRGLRECIDWYRKEGWL